MPPNDDEFTGSGTIVLDDPAEARIIEIRKGVTVPRGMPPSDESPLEPPQRYGEECKHLRARLDADERSVECRQCGATIDAFDYLLEISREWERCASWVRHAKWQKRQLDAEVETLKAERKRLRADCAKERKRRGLPKREPYCLGCKLESERGPCPRHGVPEPKEDADAAE